MLRFFLLSIHACRRIHIDKKHNFTKHNTRTTLRFPLHLPLSPVTHPSPHLQSPLKTHPTPLLRDIGGRQNGEAGDCRCRATPPPRLTKRRPPPSGDGA
ncbi:hypothetical protein HanRHA438_Chr13g0580301 [Helianthus annuus]|nr:hypothetical protein HanRHA438_Chr13g0580301 [Helianthus annuus]